MRPPGLVHHQRDLPSLVADFGQPPTSEATP